MAPGTRLAPLSLGCRGSDFQRWRRGGRAPPAGLSSQPRDPDGQKRGCTERLGPRAGGGAGMVSPLVQSSELTLHLGIHDMLLTAFKIRRKKKEYNQNEGIRMNLDWVIFVFLPSQS